MSTALKALADTAREFARAAETEELRQAYSHLREMLSGASSGASSPLLEELKDRISNKGGDVVDRLRNQIAGALLLLLMRMGLSQSEACKNVAKASGIGVATLKRMVQGVTVNNIEDLPDWKAYQSTIEGAGDRNPQREGESVFLWQQRVALSLANALADTGHVAVSHGQRRKEIAKLFAKRGRPT